MTLLEQLKPSPRLEQLEPQSPPGPNGAVGKEIRHGRAGRKNSKDLESVAQQLLLLRAIDALQQDDLKTYELLRGAAEGDGDMTEHEKYLDVRRVWITAGLVVALFAVVGIILLRSSIASTATPYVSLLSGLAGIALGWMFASSGAKGSKQPPASRNVSRRPPRTE